METDASDDELSPIVVISGVMTFSTGIFLTAVRMFEPLFRVLAVQAVYQFFG